MNDPKKLFVIMSTTRGDIADELNELIDNEGWDLPRFTGEDARLTDEFCQDFADQTAEACYDLDEHVDVEYGRQRAVTAATFEVARKKTKRKS